MTLPLGWTDASFNDCFSVLSDGGKRVKQRDYKSVGTLPVVDQGEPTVGGYTDDPAMAYDGTLPVIIFGDHTRRAKLVTHRFAVGADGVKLLSPSVGVTPKFGWYLLQVADLPDRGYGRHFQYLRALRFPLPPLAEQHRIVEAIEEQCSRLDAGVASLRRARRNLTRMRASVLAAAVEGRLVEPEGEWATVTVGEVARLERGVSYRKEVARQELAAGYLPLLRATNIADGRLLMDDDLIFVPESVVHPTQMLQEHDLVIATSSGSSKVVGKSALFRGSWIGTFGAFCGVLRPLQAIQGPYLAFVAQSDRVRQQWSLAASGTNINNLKVRDILETTLQLPSLAEQQRIVEEVDRQFSILDAMEATIAAGLARADRLRQSILKEAFAGRLVPQDPADEPASALLDRIAAGRTDS